MFKNQQAVRDGLGLICGLAREWRAAVEDIEPGGNYGAGAGGDLIQNDCTIALR